MARRPYAGTATDYVIDAAGTPLPGRDSGGTVLVSGTAWTADTGGTQVTDLQNLDGSAITDGVLVPDQTGRLPRFLGPDPDTAGKLWIDFGAGRYLFLATDVPDRLYTLETGGVQSAGQQYPATAVVYSSTYRATRPATNSGQFTWTCDGTNDEAEINAAITAVAASNKGGKVLLLGNLFNLGGSVALKTGVALQGEGLGTILKAASDFNAGMVTLADISVHATHLSMLTLDGASKGVHGIHYVGGNLGSPTGETFTTAPNTNPDPTHWVRDVNMNNIGNSTFAGYGLYLYGGNLRAGKYSDMRILNASGCGVFVNLAVDSHFTNIEVGSSGDATLGYSESTTAPLGHGWYVTSGTNCMFTSCKAWYSKGAGFFNKGVRNGYVNCQAQDNYSHGFHVNFGKSSFVGCHADSNGQGLGDAGSGGGRSGFYLQTDFVSLNGCQSYDRGRGWQNYGFQFASGNNRSRVTGCVTYANTVASQTGTAGTGTTVDIIADSGGK